MFLQLWGWLGDQVTQRVDWSFSEMTNGEPFVMMTSQQRKPMSSAEWWASRKGWLTMVSQFSCTLCKEMFYSWAGMEEFLWAMLMEQALAPSGWMTCDVMVRRAPSPTVFLIRCGVTMTAPMMKMSLWYALSPLITQVFSSVECVSLPKKPHFYHACLASAWY